VKKVRKEGKDIRKWHFKFRKNEN